MLTYECSSPESRLFQGVHHPKSFSTVFDPPVPDFTLAKIEVGYSRHRLSSLLHLVSFLFRFFLDDRFLAPRRRTHFEKKIRPASSWSCADEPRTTHPTDLESCRVAASSSFRPTRNSRLTFIQIRRTFSHFKLIVNSDLAIFYQHSGWQNIKIKASLHVAKWRIEEPSSLTSLADRRHHH